MDNKTDRAESWVATMGGFVSGSMVQAHRNSKAPLTTAAPYDRRRREEDEQRYLNAGASHALGAGNRDIEEHPDTMRTCFEVDRDRILHKSQAFRRLAGKTQVFIFPDDHLRTRLTHALEVTQVASAISRALGLNVALTEAIALGHDCGHGPFGHASEDALTPYLPGGFDHAPFGADVVLKPLNLTAETLDGVRNHSWSRPAPNTPEGEVVSLSDRIAYVCHDFEDAVDARIISAIDLPGEVVANAGQSRGEQLDFFITDVIVQSLELGAVGLSHKAAQTLGAFRSFNYQHIYNRPESVAQAKTVIALLSQLVEAFLEDPTKLPWDLTTKQHDEEEALRIDVVNYVAGMTDRYVIREARRVLGDHRSPLPLGIDIDLQLGSLGI